MKKNENYLERIPKRNKTISWSEKDGAVSLEIENKGIMNRVMQLLFKKPKISYVHLDEMGSFVWPIIDGESDIIKIGEKVKAHFGENAEPLYERLVTFFNILESYGFINWN